MFGYARPSQHGLLEKSCGGLVGSAALTERLAGGQSSSQTVNKMVRFFSVVAVLVAQAYGCFYKLGVHFLGVL